MAQLNTKVKLYLEANSKVYSSELNNYVLQNDCTILVPGW